MTAIFLLCATLAGAPADETAPPEAIQKYLADCESAKQATLRKLGSAIERSSGSAKQVDAQRQEFKKLKELPAALLPLPLPPEKGGIGIFAPPEPGDGRGGRSVDVLEVVDEDDAILRVWYAPAPSSTGKTATPEDPTFIDLWVHGVDTSGWKVNKPAQLPQVFQATGIKTFDTTCGGRSMILLEPVDVERFRSAVKTPDAK